MIFDFGCPSAEVRKKFVVSVDHLEELTGIDFFQGLPDGLEETLEAGIGTDSWKFF
ncbi:MAG TPA: hypothetical protein VLZ54_08725 [Arenibacter sp.]|nr:hypothetical protein [Arenibacter sp.]